MSLPALQIMALADAISVAFVSIALKHHPLMLAET